MFEKEDSVAYTRYITAAVAIPAVLALVFFASPPLFLGVVMVLAFIAYREFLSMFGVRRPIVSLPAGAALMLTIYGCRYHTGFFPFYLAASLIGITALSLWGDEEVSEKTDRAVLHLAGFLYLVIPFSFFAALRDYPTPEEGKMWFLFAIVLPWVCDSAAYFVGCAFGKHLIAPLISPKKTWEGAIAGLIASVAAGAIFSSVVFAGKYFVFCLVTAVLASTAGQIGDLVESLFKRGAGVKDSGNLFPGHGGLLDRLDSVFFSVMTVYLALASMAYHAS